MVYHEFKCNVCFLYKNTPAPKAVVGGKNMPASDAANTAPRPIARGARMLRNSPDGAQIAIVLRPPTTPAVYL